MLRQCIERHASPRPRLHVPLAVFCAIWVGLARGQSFPLWEAGIGAAVIDFPHYRGSDQRHAYVLPLPYFVFRGEKIRADRQGLRGLLFDTDRVALDVSANGSLPVNSQRNRARAGMADLDPTFELGPSLNLRLAGTDRAPATLDLRLPLRAVMATDASHLRHVGWVFQPQLALTWKPAFGQPGWQLGAAAGPVFGDRRLHRYFYGVGPADATPSRPVTHPGEGYAGMQFTTTISRRYGRAWFGAFVRYDTLDGAVFANSPLVRTHSNFTAGCGLAWVLAESSRRVAED